MINTLFGLCVSSNVFNRFCRYFRYQDVRFNPIDVDTSSGTIEILNKIKEYGLIPPNLEIKIKSVGYSHWTGIPGSLVPIEIAVTYIINYNGYFFGKFIVCITAGHMVERVSCCCRFFEVEKKLQ